MLRVMATVMVTKKIVTFIWTHPANEGERARALMRAASFQIRARLLRRRTLARLGDRSKVWADLHRTFIYWESDHNGRGSIQLDFIE